MKLLLLIIIYLMMTACMPKAKESSELLYLADISSEELSEDFRTLLYESIVELNAEAGKDIVSFKKTGRPLFIYSKKEGFIGEKNILAHAQYMKYRCFIEFDEENKMINKSNIDKKIDVKYILLHEIGHCYGHLHNKDKNHIMYEAYSGSYGMSQYDLDKIKVKISNFLFEILK